MFASTPFFITQQLEYLADILNANFGRFFKKVGDELFKTTHVPPLLVISHAVSLLQVSKSHSVRDHLEPPTLRPFIISFGAGFPLEFGKALADILKLRVAEAPEFGGSLVNLFLEPFQPQCIPRSGKLVSLLAELGKLDMN